MMFGHLLVLFLLLSGSVVSGESVASVAGEKSCRQHPQLIGKCFTVRGRLSVYNGAPALRLWKVGTRRVLGISDQRFALEGYRNVPQHIERQLAAGRKECHSSGVQLC